VMSAASFCRTMRSVTRPDGSPPIATRNGLPMNKKFNTSLPWCYTSTKLEH